MRNAAELLRLLHATGRLEEAIDVASKYMLAIMGHGKEYYGLKTSMCPTSEVIYCPVAAINNLILELKLQIENNNDEFIKVMELVHSNRNRKYILNFSGLRITERLI